ncbi:MAG: peptidoglycan editing factor PgeF [Patescibacteria group bacterium]|nr:peptidoglycan editing factor PgeF [Patescibacteria group bacterium]
MFNNLVWGISQKKDGSMKLMQAGSMEKSLANRQRFFSSLDLDTNNLVAGYLAHGTHVQRVAEIDRGKIIPDTDGLVTDSRDVILTVTAADCLPIYFFDPKHRAIGLAHAGWKGVLNEMSGQMVQAMQSSFGTEPADLEVYIGPHNRHYNVLKDRADLFMSFSNFVIQEGDAYQLDLSGIVKLQLANAGVTHVQISPECTHCETEKCFSFQRDKPEEPQAMVAYIGIKP